METVSASQTQSSRQVLAWYDFICPFCYVGQQRTALLVKAGFKVVELPFQAHPEIPMGGVAAGPRNGPMYVHIEREAQAAGLPLNWPPRLPNTRFALAAAEWVRQRQPDRFGQFHHDLFAAHFVLGEDLGDRMVVDRHAKGLGIDVVALHAAMLDGSAPSAAEKSEKLGSQMGVRGTPAWLVDGRLISGLQPVSEFERLAATQPPGAAA